MIGRSSGGFWKVRTISQNRVSVEGDGRNPLTHRYSPKTARQIAALLNQAADEIDPQPLTMEEQIAPEPLELVGCECQRPTTVYVTNYFGVEPD